MRINRRTSLVHSLAQTLLLGSLLILAACSSSPPEVITTPVPSMEATGTPTETALPSPTVTPQIPRVILWAPPGSDAALAASLEATLDRLATQDGLLLEVSQDLNPADLNDVSLVVTLPPDSGILDLAEDAPETQFLAVGMADVEAGGNISTIEASGNRPDEAAFIAGYLSAAVTPDWRVGVLSEPDTPTGNAAQHGFANGVIYFCGLCRPVYPPFPMTGYPIVEPLSPVSGPSEWQVAVTNLQTWQVSTVFVDPGIGSEELYRELANAGMNIVSTDEPPDGLSSQWIASIRSGDPVEAVEEMWPDLIAGQGGIEKQMLVSFEDANPDLFSLGRQELVKEMLTEFSEGYIDTGVDPATGEPKF